jgi:hypothetical protein
MSEEFNFKFEVDNDIKQEFLETQIKSTRKFYEYVLKRVDEFEKELSKKVYDFNYEDRDEILLVQFKNGSIWAVQVNLAPIKKYVDFCIMKNMVKHNENRFAIILDYEKYVNTQAVENAYISKDTNRELQEMLINNQDKLFIDLVGVYGIRGRTEKGNTLEEIINLRVKEDVNWDSKILTLISNNNKIRHVEVDDYTLNLIKETINDTYYTCNNGFKKKKNEHGYYDKTERGFIINKTEYVFRVPGKNKFSKTNTTYFSNKISRIQKWLEKPYLNVGNLYFSAMIDYAKNLKEEKGELTKEDYVYINERFNYGSDGEKYAYKTEEMVNKYI